MKALFVVFLTVEALLLALLWTVAISGFWASVIVGIVACAMAVLVTACVVATARIGREDLWR